MQQDIWLFHLAQPGQRASQAPPGPTFPSFISGVAAAPLILLPIVLRILMLCTPP